MLCEEIKLVEEEIEEIEPVQEEIEKKGDDEELSVNMIMNYKKALERKQLKVLQFLGDTGAQMHCMMSDTGTLTNEMKVTATESFGNASKTKIEKKRDLNVMMMEGMGMALKQIHVIPGCGRNIISLAQMQKEGWDYHTKKGKLFLSRGNADIELEEKEMNLYYLKLQVVSNKDIKTFSKMKVFATELEMKQAAMVSEDDEDYDPMLPDLMERESDSDLDSSDDEMESQGKWKVRKD